MELTVEQAIDEIVKTRQQDLKEGITRSPANNFRFSDIPDCDRYLCYMILNWQEKQMFDEYVMARLRKGNEEERNVKSELNKLGFEVILEQAPFELKNKTGEVIARGKIDGKVIVFAIRFPLEIKSATPNMYDQINSYDDLDKKPYLRKYKRQMQMYLYNSNQEYGIILFTDCLGHWKLIPVYLDYAECEWILQRLERTWELVKKKEYADRLPTFSDPCDMCGFNHICLPDIINKPPEMIDNKDIEAALDRRKELKSCHSEYNSIDKKVKEKFRNIEKVIIGTKWQIITIRKPERKLDMNSIPDNVKEPYMIDSEKVTVKILEIGK